MSMKVKINLLLIVSVLIIDTLLAVSFFARFWLIELIVSFAPQIIILSIILTIVSFIIFIFNKIRSGDRKLYRILLIFSGLLIVFNLFYSLNVQTPVKISSSSGETLKFATFNKMFTNGEVGKIVRYIQPKNVDVIAFQEIKESEIKLAASRLGYKYYYLIKPVNKKHNSSVGIVSRLMVDKFSYTSFGEGYGALKASVRLSSGTNISFYSTHLMSPLTNGPQSDIQIDRLADILNRDNSPIVIGGDFNTTIFSKKIKDFNQKTKYKINPTATEPWPDNSWYGFGRAAAMRIDQVYIPNEFDVKSVEIAPDLGSDHRMIISEIIL